jgi:sugar O-acyltransferase (sialic acid O-acetyltransferase NeuD family)
MSKKRLVVFGSGEIATLARYYFGHDSDYDVVAFTVDDAYVDRESLEGLPLVPFSKIGALFDPNGHEMFVGLSYGKLNRLREEKYLAARRAGYRLATYLCSRCVTWPGVKIGENCFILENQTLQPGVTVGDNVMLWSGNHIGHGTRIGDHTYVASHVVISGHCRIGQRCFLGVNATVRDFCTIGDDCFVAMDASVTADLVAGSVCIGRAGEVFKGDDRRARALKRQYFKV